MNDIISSYYKAAEESINNAGDEIRQLQCGTDVDDQDYVSCEIHIKESLAMVRELQVRDV